MSNPRYMVIFELKEIDDFKEWKSRRDWLQQILFKVGFLSMGSVCASITHGSNKNPLEAVLNLKSVLVENAELLNFVKSMKVLRVTDLSPIDRHFYSYKKEHERRSLHA